MSKGVILFAFNSTKFNYYDMAVITAKRINHFLDLPVTIITDVTSVPENIDYVFDSAARVGGIYANDHYSGEFIYENTQIQTNLIDISL